MKNKFLSAVKNYNMFSPGDSVLVGLSGGADSMSLLNLLIEFSEELQIKISAAHINHMIRGEEADRDEIFVREYCNKRSIPLYILKKDIPALALETGKSTELIAREVRYEFFDSLSADKIATAHTGSDAVETMLMNLSRGASLHGISSIPPVRGKIVRPLINIRREEIEAYCRENDIPYVNDSTNAGTLYTRNKYRHNIIPGFQKVNPDFEASALRCIGLLRQDDDYIFRQALSELNANTDEKGSLCIKNLKEVHPALFSRIISLYLEKFTSSDYEMRHIELLKNNCEASFSLVLPGNIRVSISDGFLFPDNKEETETQEDIIITKDRTEEFSFYSKKYKVFSDSSSFSPDFSGCFIADYDKIGGKITVRSRKAGDEIILSGRHCRKTLKKLFNEMKIPADERKTTAVFSDDKGIIYVEGVGIDADRLPGKNTDKFLIIKSE